MIGSDRLRSRIQTISRLASLCMACAAATGLCEVPSAAVAKLPVPTIYPSPGTYFNTTSLSLMDEAPGAEIHYTWDGSEPSASSPIFDPRGVLFIAGLYDGNKGLKTGHTLRAVATKPGATLGDHLPARGIGRQCSAAWLFLILARDPLTVHVYAAILEWNPSARPGPFWCVRGCDVT